MFAKHLIDCRRQAFALTRPVGLACALLVGLMLAGCTTVPGAANADADATSAVTAPLQQSAWWTSFGDPLLSQLVTQALQANTSIRSAQAALQQANLAVTQAQAQLAAARTGRGGRGVPAGGRGGRGGAPATPADLTLSLIHISEPTRPY